MFKHILSLILLCVSVAVNAQSSRSFVQNVRTTQIMLNDEWGQLPVMQLGSDDVLHFSFDEMSHVYHRYTYRIVHCNAAVATFIFSGKAFKHFIDGRVRRFTILGTIIHYG